MRVELHIAFLTAASCIISSRCSADSLKVILTKQPTVMERLQEGAVGSRDRKAAIERLFESAGCSTEEQTIPHRAANVICTSNGQSPSTIVVGGHYDFAELGAGIVDDWSGTSLLPSLYEALIKQPRKHTFRFIAFAGEEQGLLGSKHYVSRLSPDDVGSIRAFVNLECLGLNPPEVWTSRADPQLLRWLAEVAGGLHTQVQGVNVEKVGDDDSHPFFSKKIPVLTLHSIDQKTWKILHSPSDRIEAIHPDEYYLAYRLAAFYLAYLDAKLD